MRGKQCSTEHVFLYASKLHRQVFGSTLNVSTTSSRSLLSHSKARVPFAILARHFAKMFAFGPISAAFSSSSTLGLRIQSEYSWMLRTNSDFQSGSENLEQTWSAHLAMRHSTDGLETQELLSTIVFSLSKACFCR